jgi:hypothetical protein
MNTQELLDYALGQLDGPSRERFERQMAGDPQLGETAEHLGQAIHLLLDDGAEVGPPPGLAARTIVFVSEHRHRRSWNDYVPVTVPFRWADAAVAAAIFLASLLTLLPAVQRSKDQTYQAACGWNLQQVGRALAQYATLHNVYPYAAPDSPGARAGSFAGMLYDAGLLDGFHTLRCPCRGPHRHTTPPPESMTVAELRERAPEKYHELLRQNDYAYHLGFRTRSGRPGPVPMLLQASIPLVADEPPHEEYRRILDGNSPNHRGRGQNVLFSDGRVVWHPTRRLGPEDSDMFLNAEQQIAPGVNLKDAALGASLVPFAGYRD